MCETADLTMGGAVMQSGEVVQNDVSSQIPSIIVSGMLKVFLRWKQVLTGHCRCKQVDERKQVLAGARVRLGSHVKRGGNRWRNLLIQLWGLCPVGENTE